MPVLIFIGALLALWAFIVWDRRRPVAPLSRERLARGLAPAAPKVWPMFAGLSAVGGLLGLVAWLEPGQPPFTGRLAWLKTLAYAQLGPAGPALLWWAAALLMAVLAFWGWRGKLVVKSREP